MGQQNLQQEIERLVLLRPEIPTYLVRISERCLKWNPLERYSDASQLLAELRLGAAEISLNAPLPAQRTWSRTRLAALACYILIICGVVGVTANWKSPKEVERTETASLNSSAATDRADSPPIESNSAYALGIQAAFDKLRSDSVALRQRTVDRAVAFLPSTPEPFEVGYLRCLGEHQREYSLNLGNSHLVICARMSSDGRWLAFNGPKQDIALFDVENNRLVRRFAGLRLGAFRLAISPDNRYLLGVSSIFGRGTNIEPQVLVWNFETAELLFSLNEHLGLIDVRSCEFISHDQFLLSGAFRDGDRIKVFSIADRQLQQVDSTYPLNSQQGLLEENFDYQVIERSRDNNSIRELVFVDKAEQKSHAYPLDFKIGAFSLSPHGLFAWVESPSNLLDLEDPHNTKTKSRIVVWNLQTQAEVFHEQVDGWPITALTIAADEKTIIYLDSRGYVFQRGIEYRSLERFHSALAPHEAWCIDFHPSESKVLLAGDAGQVAVHNLETRQYSQWPLHAEMLVTHCRWRPGQSDQFATSSFDGTVRLWSLKNAAPVLLAEIPHPSRVRCLAFSSDGAKIATGCDDHAVRVYEVESRRLERTFAKHNDKIRGLAFTQAADRLFSCGNDALGITWSLSTGQHQELEYLSSNGICTAISPDGQWHVFGTQAGVLGIRSLTDPTQAKDISVSTAWLRCLAISSDSRTLATGTQDGKIALWNLATGIKLADFSTQPSAIMSLSFSADNRTLAAGLYSGQLIFWQTSDSTR